MLLLENRIGFLGKGLCSAIGKSKTNLKFKKWNHVFFLLLFNFYSSFFFINLEETVYLLQLPQPEILGQRSQGSSAGCLCPVTVWLVFSKMFLLLLLLKLFLGM